MNLETTLPTPVTRTARALSVTAGVLLLAIMALTVADVISRNLRDRSIVGTVDITTMLLVAVAYLGLASGELERRHVSVELFETRFSPRVRVALSVVRAALLGALGLLITWGLTGVLLSAIDRGETTNDVLRLPTWPAKLVLLVSFACFFVVAIWEEIVTYRQLQARVDTPVPEVSR